MEDFIYKWQELAGALIGPFLALLLSAFSYYVGRKVEKWKLEKEAMRRIEVGTTYSLNSVATMEKKLQTFVRSLRQLVADIHAETNPRTFALQTVNFPAIGRIYLDEELLKLPTKSYYVHNKLLWIDAGIRDVNNILANIKEDFDRVIRLNEKLLDLMRDNPDPPAQRRAYAENLSLFADEIQRFASTDLKKGVTPMIQLKIYNDKLRAPYMRGTRVRWEYEGVSSWILQTVLGFKEPQRHLNNIDSVDEILQPELETALSEMEARRQQIEREDI